MSERPIYGEPGCRIWDRVGLKLGRYGMITVLSFHAPNGLDKSYAGQDAYLLILMDPSWTPTATSLSHSHPYHV